MTDSNSDVQQDNGQPTHDVQPQMSVQQNSPSVDDLVAKLSEKLTPQIESIIERKVQSTKDRRINALEKQYSGLSDIQQVLAEAKELRSKGLSDDQVEDKMLLRRLVESLTQPPVTAQAPGQAQPVVEDHARKILSEAGINEGDPEVVELARKQYASEAERVAAYASFVIRRSNKPQPNPAQATQTVPANIPNVDLAVAYQKELENIKGDDRANQVIELRKKYRQRGLQV